MLRKGIKNMVIVGLLIVAMFTMVPNVAAYTVGPSGGSSKPCNGWGSNDYKATHIVQLCFDTFSDAWSLYTIPGPAADVVLQVARQKGMEIKRSKGSIETEIKAHAYLRLQSNIPIYRNGAWRWTWEIANPMDIEMYGAELWVYLLD